MTTRGLVAWHLALAHPDDTHGSEALRGPGRRDAAALTKHHIGQATAAVDSLTVTWNAEAAKSAKQYLGLEAFSCTGLITQLDSPDGTQYTVAQATYGAQQAGAC